MSPSHLSRDTAILVVDCCQFGPSWIHLSRATAMFVVDWCQFGPSWIFGLKMELMACAGLVGGTTEQICLLPDLI